MIRSMTQPHRLAGVDKRRRRSRIRGRAAPEHEPAGEPVQRRHAGSVAAGRFGERKQVAGADREQVAQAPAGVLRAEGR